MKWTPRVTSFCFLASFAVFFLPNLRAVSADVFLQAPPVQLTWVQGIESDIQGYEVYRAASSAGPYTKVSSDLVAGVSWQDWNVSAGYTYCYTVRAVDSVGNRSNPSAPSEAAVISTGDFDSDGFTDEFESTVGSNPLDPSSFPAAEELTLIPDKALLSIGSTASFAVRGLFRTQSGEALEYDMTCRVKYQSSPGGIVTVDPCGGIVGEGQGTTSVWVSQVKDSQTITESNRATMTVDGLSPYVNTYETQPYDSQGIHEDTNGNGRLDAGEDLDADGVLDQDTGQTSRVANDSGIIIRVADNPIGDNIGINEQSIQLLLNGVSVPVKVWPVRAGDLHEVDIAWTNQQPFSYGQIIIAELTLSDAAGNEMYYRESFQAETESQHQWALEHRPLATTRTLGNGMCETTITPLPDSVNDEPLAGTKLVYNCDEPVQPRFGPVDELPPVDIAAPANVPVEVEPIALFDGPVTLAVPMPEATLRDADGDGVPDSGLEDYLLYQFSAHPSVQWREISEAAGWTVEGWRLNQYDSTPASIQVQVLRSSGIQPASNEVASPPTPDIKINGTDGPLTVAPNTPVSIVINLNPGAHAGLFADWWIVAETRKGRYYYRCDKHRWQTRVRPSAQMPLTVITSEEIFAGTPPFGSGSYTVYFAVDANADGKPDLDWKDAVDVNVKR